VIGTAAAVERYRAYDTMMLQDRGHGGFQAALFDNGIADDAATIGAPDRG